MSITINGKDVRTTWGLLLDAPGGVLTAPSRQLNGLVVPGRAGLTLGVTTPQESIRELRINGVILGTSASDARTKADNFKAELSKDTLTVISLDQSARQIVGRLVSCSVESPGVYYLNRHLQVSVVLQCLDPYWYEVATTSVGLSSAGDTFVPLGNAPTRPIITITGGTMAAITITLKKNDGTAIQSMTVTTALIATDVLVIDCNAMTIKKNGAHLISALTAGDFFLLDALSQGTFDTAAWPKMTYSGYTGGTVTVSYPKAWR